MWNGKHTESETFKSPNSPEVNYRIKTVLSRVMWFHSAFPLPLRVLLFLPSPRKKKKKLLGAAGPARLPPPERLSGCPRRPPATTSSQPSARWSLSALSQGDAPRTHSAILHVSVSQVWGDALLVPSR